MSADELRDGAVGASHIPYPSAPWRLRGFGFQTLRIIDVSAARAFVPPGLTIVPVWAGKTLGSVYFASYEQGSSLVYHEIVIAAGLVWHGASLGFALPRLYVDSPQSLAGGREIWGAPKELADFTVKRSSGETSVEVRQDGRDLMSLRFRPMRWAVPAWVPLPSYGVRGDELMYFVGRVRGRMTVASSDVSFAADSPFLPLCLGGSGVAIAYPILNLLVPAPSVVGRVTH
jgi:hypothetical protein